jgi:hypothetical protein
MLSSNDQDVLSFMFGSSPAPQPCSTAFLRSASELASLELEKAAVAKVGKFLFSCEVALFFCKPKKGRSRRT